MGFSMYSLGRVCCLVLLFAIFAVPSNHASFVSRSRWKHRQQEGALEPLQSEPEANVHPHAWMESSAHHSTVASTTAKLTAFEQWLVDQWKAVNNAEVLALAPPAAAPHIQVDHFPRQFLNLARTGGYAVPALKAAIDTKLMLEIKMSQKPPDKVRACVTRCGQLSDISTDPMKLSYCEKIWCPIHFGAAVSGVLAKIERIKADARFGDALHDGAANFAPVGTAPAAWAYLEYALILQPENGVMPQDAMPMHYRTFVHVYYGERSPVLRMNGAWLNDGGHILSELLPLLTSSQFPGLGASSTAVAWAHGHSLAQTTHACQAAAPVVVPPAVAPLALPLAGANIPSYGGGAQPCWMSVHHVIVPASAVGALVGGTGPHMYRLRDITQDPNTNVLSLTFDRSKPTDYLHIYDTPGGGLKTLYPAAINTPTTFLDLMQTVKLRAQAIYGAATPNALAAGLLPVGTNHLRQAIPATPVGGAIVGGVHLLQGEQLTPAGAVAGRYSIVVAIPQAGLQPMMVTLYWLEPVHAFLNVPVPVPVAFTQIGAYGIGAATSVYPTTANPGATLHGTPAWTPAMAAAANTWAADRITFG